MRRHLLLQFCSICTLFATFCNATLAANDRTRTDTRGMDSLYLQIYGGINKSANENLPMSEFSSYPWSGGLFVGIGEEFNALWGWRAALRYNYNKSRNVQECESPETWGWNSLGLFGDITFDITDALQSAKNRGTRFNVKAFAGVGLSYAFGYPKDVDLSYIVPYSTKNRIVPAARAGLDFTYKINERLKVGMELSHTIFDDRFNGVKTGSPLDMRSNIKIGVTIALKTKDSPITPLGPVVYDHRLRTIPPLPFKLPDAEDTKVRTIQGRAFLDFPVNETIIDPRYRRNPEELKRMRKTIEEALFDKTFKVQRVVLHGYASPESPYANNNRLAIGRTQSLKSHICKKFGIDASIVETNHTPEDWTNLRSFIETRGESRRIKGDIWYERETIVETPVMPQYVLDNRDELLRVIDLDMDPDEKEAMLKRVDNGRPYNWLLQYVYPGLRHTDYTIEYIVRHYPVKEACRLIYTHPEVLSIEEMYRVAQSYGEGTDGWLDALLIAARQYPNDATANLNAACGCVRMHRLTDAKTYLKKADGLAEARYLADVIQAMEGTVKWRMEGNKVVITEKRI
ncbi:MAG: hypothetical protein ACI4B3_07210 [Prevotella sp.]